MVRSSGFPGRQKGVRVDRFWGRGCRCRGRSVFGFLLPGDGQAVPSARVAFDLGAMRAPWARWRLRLVVRRREKRFSVV
jgi:hypothetical protein